MEGKVVFRRDVMVYFSAFLVSNMTIPFLIFFLVFCEIYQLNFSIDLRNFS